MALQAVVQLTVNPRSNCMGLKLDLKCSKSNHIALCSNSPCSGSKQRKHGQRMALKAASEAVERLYSVIANGSKLGQLGKRRSWNANIGKLADEPYLESQLVLMWQKRSVPQPRGIQAFGSAICFTSEMKKPLFRVFSCLITSTDDMYSQYTLVCLISTV